MPLKAAIVLPQVAGLKPKGLQRRLFSAGAYKCTSQITDVAHEPVLNPLKQGPWAYF